MSRAERSPSQRPILNPWATPPSNDTGVARKSVRPLPQPPTPLIEPSVRRILVLGIIPSLTWSVTRCLSRAGYRPVVLGWHRVSPLQLVPDCTYVPLSGVRWVDGELAPQLLDQVDAACREHNIDLVLPVDFPSVLLLARHGARIRSARVAAVPDPELMLNLHDKWQFSHRLQALGIPQPATEIAHNAAELRSTRLSFPIITKPTDRWASVGFQIHHSPSQLSAALASDGLATEFPVLVQEFIPGKDVGFAFLARHGKLVAYAAFEQPRKGTRRYFDAPELHRHVAKLIEATGYHGVGEIDARYDPARDEYRLLEINPRFWASLLYAGHAGMNFPELLARMPEVGPAQGFTAQQRPVRLTPYELGVAKAVQLTERAHAFKVKWLGD